MQGRARHQTRPCVLTTIPAATSQTVRLRVNGKLHRIGMGRTLVRTPVILLVDVRILDSASGEPLRELTVDPTRDYRPTGKDRYARWRQKQKQTDP